MAHMVVADSTLRQGILFVLLCSKISVTSGIEQLTSENRAGHSKGREGPPPVNLRAERGYRSGLSRLTGLLWDHMLTVSLNARYMFLAVIRNKQDMAQLVFILIWTKLFTHILGGIFSKVPDAFHDSFEQREQNM
jgi:hypothetical protein